MDKSTMKSMIFPVGASLFLLVVAFVSSSELRTIDWFAFVTIVVGWIYTGNSLHMTKTEMSINKGKNQASDLSKLLTSMIITLRKNVDFATSRNYKFRDKKLTAIDSLESMVYSDGEFTFKKLLSKTPSLGDKLDTIDEVYEKIVNKLLEIHGILEEAIDGLLYPELLEKFQDNYEGGLTLENSRDPILSAIIDAKANFSGFSFDSRLERLWGEYHRFFTEPKRSKKLTKEFGELKELSKRYCKVVRDLITELEKHRTGTIEKYGLSALEAGKLP